MFRNCNVEIEHWRAASFKFGLQDHEDVTNILEKVCVELKSLSSGLQK